MQEALQKIAASADMPIRWHLIGHLQSNKAKKAAENFAAVHSIDSIDLLGRVDQAAVDAGRGPSVLVQVDLALEPTKHGVTVDRGAGNFRASHKVPRGPGRGADAPAAACRKP